MDKNKKKILLPILISSLLVATVYGVTQSGDNSDAGGSNNDTWEYIYDILPEESSSLDYINGTRGLITGVITSELFGSFTTDILLKQSSKIDCLPGETFSLEVSNISSIFYGDMETHSDSYYCPNKQELQLQLISSLLGIKDISGVIGVTQDVLNIFNKQEVSINGISFVNGDISKLDTFGNTNIQTIDINYQAKLNLQINKNIETVTRNWTAITNIETISSFNNSDSKDKYYYYNFEGDIGNTVKYGEIPRDYPNKGKYITISNGNFSTTNPENFSIGVTGKNTVIVKGGNIYINADIYNNNNTRDILVLIAKKDSNGNGGNIYINPDVTNIDAVLIADRSLLSYNHNYLGSGEKRILDAKNHPNILYRQLLIYGSIKTKNTIGSENIIPFGADLFDGSTTLANNIYDLINLRSFQLTFASDDVNQRCGGDDTLWVPISQSLIKEFAWAGKSRCFNKSITPPLVSGGEVPIINLRTTDKYNSLVIQYNSNIQILAPFILRSN